MSWSVIFKGKVGDAAEALAKQFSDAKSATANLPEENKQVELVEQLVTHHLQSSANDSNNSHVNVSCAGSANCDWNTTPAKVKSLQCSITVQPFDGSPAPTGGGPGGGGPGTGGSGGPG